MNFIPQKFKFVHKFFPPIFINKISSNHPLKGKKNEIYFIKFHPWNLDDIIAKKSNGG
jgi:hypothetical protein